MEEEVFDSRGRNVTVGVIGVIVLSIAGVVFRNYQIKQGRISGMLSADPARQSAAVRAMMDGFTNDGAVAEQLQGERVSVRSAAVRSLRALALQPDTPDQVRKDAAHLTVPFLKDSDQPIRDLAVQSLTDMGPATAMDAATAALGDTDATVKAGAQSVCQNLAPDSIPAILAFTGKDGATARFRTTHRVFAGNALYEISKKKHRAWTTVMVLGERATGTHGDAARPALQKLLGLSQPLLAPAGAPVLGLVDYLDPARATEEDQNNVISVLDRIGDKRAVPFLIPSVDAPATRRAAVGALGRLADRRATPALLRYLPSDESNRLEIVIALGRIADPAATEPLIRYGLGSVSDTVRAAAADSLRGIGRPARDALIAAARVQRPTPDDPELYRVAGATRALAGLSDPQAVQQAAAGLRHPAAGVREAAASALADCHDPSVVRLLIDRFEDPDGRVSGFAARSLSAFGARAVGPLVAALSRPRRVYWASLAIRYIGAPAVPALEKKLASEATDPLGARTAAVLLGDLGDTRAIPALRQALAASRDEDFSFAADNSLQRLTGAPATGTG